MIEIKFKSNFDFFKDFCLKKILLRSLYMIYFVIDFFWVMGFYLYFGW